MAKPVFRVNTSVDWYLPHCFGKPLLEQWMRDNANRYGGHSAIRALFDLIHHWAGLHANSKGHIKSSTQDFTTTRLLTTCICDVNASDRNEASVCDDLQPFIRQSVFFAIDCEGSELRYISPLAGLSPNGTKHGSEPRCEFRLDFGRTEVGNNWSKCSNKLFARVDKLSKGSGCAKTTNRRRTSK